MSSDLQEFLQLLVTHGVEFILVGGHAMAAHGLPRYTKDMDIWIDNTPSNARAMLRALDAFGFGQLGIQQADLENPDAVIQLGYEPNRIDILTGIDGVAFADARRDTIQVTFSGVLTPVISRHHLIANKRAVGRPRDLLDADELEDQ